MSTAIVKLVVALLALSTASPAAAKVLPRQAVTSTSSASVRSSTATRTGSVSQPATPTVAPTWVGSPTSDVFPPPGASKDASLFPDESELGYPGVTLTGVEPEVIATAPAYEYNYDYQPLLTPHLKTDVVNGTNAPPAGNGSSSPVPPSSSFNPIRYFGNLSPWYSTSFGLESASPIIPPQCSLNSVHLVYRHGARYPTADAAPAGFAKKVAAAAQSGNFSATGDLAFLNSWTFGLGGELLTPFGRKQSFDLGISFRQSYGELLNNFTEAGKLPVFRSESQDRMVKTALNFAAGFFGIPYEDQFELSLIVEADGFNNTFAPYDVCKNSNSPNIGYIGSTYAAQWSAIYLKDALARIQPQVPRLNLTISDLTAMLQTCAYETVALGYSSFCPIFTEQEFRGFEYALDIAFWYNNAFGSAVGAAQGAAYANELLARLTLMQPNATYNPFGANSTLNANNVTFPLGQSIYADALHEVTLLNIITALNFTSLAAGGPLPLDHIPTNQTFVSSQTAPFSTHLVGQVLDCADRGPSIRFFLNDGALPIGLQGCPEDKDGLCPLSSFIPGLQARLAEIDWAHDCLGNYTVTRNITDGRAPK